MGRGMSNGDELYKVPYAHGTAWKELTWFIQTSLSGYFDPHPQICKLLEDEWMTCDVLKLNTLQEDMGNTSKSYQLLSLEYRFFPGNLTGFFEKYILKS